VTRAASAGPHRRDSASSAPLRRSLDATYAAFGALGGASIVLIFLLGWPFEWPAIILVFLPIFYPVIAALKFDMVWFGALVVFGQTSTLAFGLALLFATGLVHSFCITPLAAVMLRSSDDAMRGRVMGVRMLAIWGLPLGLLASGPLIAGIGYVATTVLYGGLGLAATVAIGYGWRRALWHRSAAANAAYAG